MADPKGATFKGDGADFVQGVPARDLTADDWDLLTDDQKRAAKGSGLYEINGLVTPRAKDEEPEEPTIAESRPIPDIAEPSPPPTVEEAAILAGAPDEGATDGG